MGPALTFRKSASFIWVFLLLGLHGCGFTRTQDDRAHDDVSEWTIRSAARTWKSKDLRHVFSWDAHFPEAKVRVTYEGTVNWHGAADGPPASLSLPMSFSPYEVKINGAVVHSGLESGISRIFGRRVIPIPRALLVPSNTVEVTMEGQKALLGFRGSSFSLSDDPVRARRIDAWNVLVNECHLYFICISFVVLLMCLMSKPHDRLDVLRYRTLGLASLCLVPHHLLASDFFLLAGLDDSLPFRVNLAAQLVAWPTYTFCFLLFVPSSAPICQHLAEKHWFKYAVLLYLGMIVLLAAQLEFATFILVAYPAFLLCLVSFLFIGFTMWRTRPFGPLFITGTVLVTTSFASDLFGASVYLLGYGSTLYSLAGLLLLRSHLTQATVSRAIVQTTQTLAHDVRKPFLLLGAVLKSLEHEGCRDQKNAYLDSAILEIDRALEQVDGLIQDVMAAGTKSSLHTAGFDAEEILRSAFEEILRIHGDGHAEATFSIEHQGLVEVDLLKARRVFLNIMDNAMQAMKVGGRMEFRIRRMGKFVEFELANTGSFIRKPDLARVFDAFHTSGKPGGTGLGLSIVKTIVEAHGGRIACRSTKDAHYPEGRVSFVFTLPAASRTSEASLSLERPRQGGLVPVAYGLTENEGESTSESFTPNIPASPARSTCDNRKPEIAYLDDSVTFLVGARIRLNSHFIVHTFTSAESFLARIEEDPRFLGRFGLIVTDYHFCGDSGFNGTRLAVSVRAKGYSGPILLASSLERFPEGEGCHFDGLIGKAEMTVEMLGRFFRGAR